MESIQTINKRLTDRFGLDVESNRPRYRVVFADEQLESRGVIDRYLHKEVLLVPKYNFAKGRYVLEKLSKDHPSEVKNHNGYEALFVFQNNKDEFLPVVWNMVEYIVKTSLLPVEKMTDADWEALDNAEREKERQEFLAYLERPFDGALEYGEAVVVPELPGDTNE
jgi:hypothetical protein